MRRSACRRWKLRVLRVLELLLPALEPDLLPELQGRELLQLVRMLRLREPVVLLPDAPGLHRGLLDVVRDARLLLLHAFRERLCRPKDSTLPR